MQRKTRRQILAAGGALAVGTLLTQVGAAKRLQVKRQTITLPRWDADGFRVAQLTDLHVNSRAAAALAQEALSIAVSLRPDVIAITGDFYDSLYSDHFAHLRSALESVRTINIPVVGVLGNHDYWSQPKQVIETVRECGVRLLRNEIFEHHGVVIAGIDDGLVNRDRHDFLGSKGDAKSVLALFHEPDFCYRVDKRVSLMLAGHSHGGQVCYPFGKPLHLPRGARRYYSGYYPDASVPLFVSHGVGTTGPSIRAFCPPQVNLLTLQRA